MSDLEDKREGAYDPVDPGKSQPKPGARKRTAQELPSNAAPYNDEATLPEGLRRKPHGPHGSPSGRQGAVIVVRRRERRKPGRICGAAGLHLKSRDRRNRVREVAMRRQVGHPSPRLSLRRIPAFKTGLRPDSPPPPCGSF